VRYFAGLDVSLEETAICVVDETGRIMEVRAASEPSSLVAAMQRTGLLLERIGLEARSLTAWLHEGLRPAVSRPPGRAELELPVAADWPRRPGLAGIIALAPTGALTLPRPSTTIARA
jgi:hypothetical protein